MERGPGLGLSLRKMNLNNIEVIVLATKKYHENNMLLVCFAKNMGKIVVVAPQARQIKSRLRSFCQVIVQGTVALQAPTGNSKYYILRQAQILDSFPRVKSDPYKLASAGYIVSLINKMTVEEQCDLMIYQILDGYLKALSNLTVEQQVTYLHSAIVLRLLVAAGYNAYPQSCHRCDVEVNEGWYEDVKGRIYCGDCFPQGKQISRQSAKQWHALLQNLSSGEWPTIDPETVMAIERYVKYLIGSEPAGQMYISLMRGY